VCLQDLDEAERHVTRQRAIIVAAQKSVKTLQADVVKKQREASDLEAQLTALQGGDVAAEGSSSELKEQLAETEGALAAAQKALDCLSKEVRLVVYTVTCGCIETLTCNCLVCECGPLRH
jgi:predicted  nucleic acid-binding Zn-ribbon protein